MKYGRLGQSGVSVANLTLGTMGFGTETPEPEAFAILDAYIEAGGNMLDTADVYGGGASEELLGRWRASRPADVTDKVLFATKARFGTGPSVNDAGSSRRHLDRALHTSLKRLGVDAIDLFQMHGWDPLTPIEETLSSLDAFVRAGKIRYIGLSNFTGWQLQLAVSTAKAMGLQMPVTLQQQYSLACREIEYEVVPGALYNGIGLLPWSPLAAGFLAGKYKRAAKPEGGRLSSDKPMTKHIANSFLDSDRNWDTLDAVKDIAATVGATPSQVALSWLTIKPVVASTIIGARTMAQLVDNLAAADLELDGGAIIRLDSVSAPTPDDYPYGLFGVLQRHRYIDSSEQALRELPTS